MYLDSQLQFSKEQALTASAVSTNDVDLGVDQNIGQGKPMAVFVSASVAADIADGNETYQVDILTDNDVAFGSPTTIASVQVSGSSLGLGQKLVIPIGHSNERYLRLSYVLGGTTPSVTLDGYLQPMTEIDGVTDYADGFAIT